MKLFGYKLPGMSSLLIWGALWEIVGRSKITYFLPSVTEIFNTFLEILPTEAFIQAVSETGYALMSGLFFATFIGIPLGILMGKNRIVDEILLPWVNIFERSLNCFGSCVNGFVWVWNEIHYYHDYSFCYLDYHAECKGWSSAN
jgi:ABC-type phosphate/phosphonate transport system permease subunit